MLKLLQTRSHYWLIANRLASRSALRNNSRQPNVFRFDRQFSTKNDVVTKEQATVIKSTIPVLISHGEIITTTFYRNMLRDHPELNNVFNQVHQKTGHQPKALAGSLYAFASNLDDLSQINHLIELIAHKHASMYIQAEQYDIVGKYLLAAMKEVLGDALTPEIGEAWGVAYWQLANILINREKELYKQANGWTTWRDFRIARKVAETGEITSFYLEPVTTDSSKAAPLPSFLPGQYISVQMDVPALGCTQNRQYSLSDRPRPDYYRISVKRERGLDIANREKVEQNLPGTISNILHNKKSVGDMVQVSHPFGDFYLNSCEEATKDSPVVLLSAGVGLTCLVSIFNDLIARQSSRPITFAHGARTGAMRPFAQSLRETARARDNVKMIFFDKTPVEGAVQGVDYHHEGRLSLEKLDSNAELHLSNPKTQYFVCGPTGFMQETERKLKGFGVGHERIHLELFGTGGVVRQSVSA